MGSEVIQDIRSPMISMINLQAADGGIYHGKSDAGDKNPYVLYGNFNKVSLRVLNTAFIISVSRCTWLAGNGKSVFP